MLSPVNSRLLATKMQIAIYNNDYEMIKKIEAITSNKQITKAIIEYSKKETKN